MKLSPKKVMFLLGAALVIIGETISIVQGLKGPVPMIPSVVVIVGGMAMHAFTSRWYLKVLAKVMIFIHLVTLLFILSSS